MDRVPLAEPPADRVDKPRWCSDRLTNGAHQLVDPSDAHVQNHLSRLTGKQHCWDKRLVASASLLIPDRTIDTGPLLPRDASDALAGTLWSGQRTHRTQPGQKPGWKFTGAPMRAFECLDSHAMPRTLRTLRDATFGVQTTIGCAKKRTADCSPPFRSYTCAG